MSQVQSIPKKKKRLRLLHFYPDLLNLYGDYGNILAIQRRAEWRGIEVEIDNLDLNSPLDLNIKDYDIAFIGGGQDRQQVKVADDFLARKEKIAEAVNDGLVILAICGGYQLLGKYYESSEGEQIPGLGILDVETQAQGRKSKEKQKRLIGNLSAKLKKPLKIQDYLQEKLDFILYRDSIYACDTLVGFENHSGETYIHASEEIGALAEVIQGNGNNLVDKQEGVLYKNIFGTYLHGSLLPKNPHLVDELIFRALDRRGEQLSAEEWLSLDDSFELQAHKKALSLR
ncbi:MAG: glutamine amidotransferase [Candidatus Caenarcaniphilales bacterium]|nr:glutamine amidotransferase [Candidatus Caenarcaniphilales bacterium]